MATTKGWKHAGTAEERGYGAEWKRLRLLILARDCGVCQCDECKRMGRVKVATEVDHRIPKAKGGTDDPSNLAAINADCHKRKSLIERGRKPRATIGLDGWPVD